MSGRAILLLPGATEGIPNIRCRPQLGKEAGPYAKISKRERKAGPFHPKLRLHKSQALHRLPQLFLRGQPTVLRMVHAMGAKHKAFGLQVPNLRAAQVRLLALQKDPKIQRYLCG